jgi:hypothetical protein
MVTPLKMKHAFVLMETTLIVKTALVIKNQISKNALLNALLALVRMNVRPVGTLQKPRSHQALVHNVIPPTSGMLKKRIAKA